jgi:hypothetical protein
MFLPPRRFAVEMISAPLWRNSNALWQLDNVGRGILAAVEIAI